ncbi:hypothetical protein EIP86_007755 [Pleurotus ostreatoroseus]|nr:hypothetical protein EIP86_007755 [Pleurotus ostreatoroseus]
MGWIFYKQTYERMNLVDAKDLEVDKVPITLVMAFLTPVFIGALWGDAPGAFVWAGLVKCLFVWHCTFLINSAAHWDGVQPYSDEDTSRTNLLLALLTGGEGNHNFHSFPHDFRSGPTLYEWDPSKWIILGLHYFSLATNLKRARQIDLDEAKRLMSAKQNGSARIEKDAANPRMNVPSWTMDEARAYAVANPGRCVLIVNDCCVDATAYLSEHPGGALILRKYALRGIEQEAKNGTNADAESPLWKQATWAFGGGLNNHSRAAKRRLEELVIARVSGG